ncbi:NAD(P)/FAD-dependent oxidoreductase [Lutimaribacter sp. EGI FJ00015]|uniref:NAD(P)/FAD-dependent oxidoreductase n=1 Tax=Lutimaribacter degradans TaxID=2945989 RepID=A0ACC5ZX19_9RHOB|nr:NAD(P)/FAD-dependent oxidoreductase [Lutimaribacter sp. EGI FJ00013]MCM2562871.1 NAD(P)/FAD-dependent oxidoreductase [Lutimaribacter sp. EGI FJ00013]MCO0614028.1 NAD(P)/FAD-dependent oxidoreductase [Lutimaribacter sp. EGI FJ00015]MCO0637000.1 NAD(P)/FAD-dependent oxidoreductase [Lutimaribacter sp. EGI FJ00014]
MSDKTDAIVIGAGHNSLACAAHLSAKGWSVRVLEQAGVPGGAVKSGEYTAPGFVHDWAAMNLSLFAGSAFHQKYAENLAGHGLAFAPASDCFASVFPDDTWLGVSNDPEVTAARIRAENPRDADAWEALTAEFPDFAETLVAVLGSPMKARAFASLGWKTWRKRGSGGTLDFARFLLSSPRGWLSETFESPKLRALLGAWGLHLDFAPDIAGGAMFPYLEGMANQAFGMVLAQGGASTVTTALVKMIESQGGTVTCNARVDRIVHDNGRATGVVLADGTTLSAEKAVIANVAPRNLAKLTGDTGEKRFDSGLAKYAHAPGTMMIHLAMDALPDWAAGPELQSFAYVHIAPDLDQMARTYAQAKAGLLPDQPVVVCGQPTVVDPGRAPDGKHVLWLQVRMAPGQILGDAAGKITATDWDSAAEPFGDRALDLLEQYAPGTRDKIIGQRIVSPVALEADNPNLVGGDQVCGSHHLTQHFMYRPVRGYADGTTPIDGLYLTGAAVWPGGGTGAGSGYLLGRKLAGE